jgi:predicted Zn-dependent peptidase
MSAWRERMMMTERNIAGCVLLVALLVPPSGFVSAQPDRSGPPPPGPPPSLKLPRLQHLKLANGMSVVLLEKHDVPLVQINLVVKAGAVMDPPGKSGLASMTAAMLAEGAGGRNALELADAIDFLGAEISAEAGMHTTGIELRTPLARLDSAIALLGDVARRPMFPASELDRTRKERLTDLVQWRDDPEKLAWLVFDGTLYGPSHPYGVPSTGKEASLRSFTTGDIRKFYKAYFVPGNTTVIVVGDVTSSALLPKLEKTFGGWRGGGKSPAGPVLPPVGQVKGKTMVLVDRPGAAQSVIMIGRVGAPRVTDDYYAIVVMNTILGGSFASRLNQNLREKHGYTYGAESAFLFRPLPGPFVAVASVQTAVTDKALGEFMNELRRILVDVPDADLERAKNYVALTFPGRFQSVGRIARRLEDLVIYDLPDDYFSGYTGRIMSVTKGEVLRAAHKYINVDNLAFIVVGDSKEIGEGVTALDLAPPTFLSVEDVLGPAPAINGAK